MTGGTGEAGRATGPSKARALVLHPELRGGPAALPGREADGRLEEAVGLARAIALDIAHAEIVRVNRPRPATLFGSGVLKTFSELVAAEEVELVVVDGALTPVQQRNLEQTLECKVIDRTALILEIFGARARTKEGRLQVELAHLTYQRSRLVRSWTHLERQRGGYGFLGGPGESQLEIDRRLIDRRITRLKRDLETVRKRRGLHRRARKRVPYPVTALVGYTNAGKSTLFNYLTSADIYAEDLLFATLDPTMRAVKLKSGREIILADTVGFISDLPTDLVAAFRATLEEVIEADVIVHVRDISDPANDAQKADVLKVLEAIGVTEAACADNGDQRPMIEALNKIDRLDPQTRESVGHQIERSNQPAVMLSALSGEGCASLLELVDRCLDQGRRIVEFDLDLSDGADLAWLYERGEVVAREDEGGRAHLRVSLDPADIARFEHRLQAKGQDADAPAQR